MKKNIRINLKLMLQRRFFWIAFAVMLALTIGLFVKHACSFLGQNIDNVTAASSAYYLNDSGEYGFPIVYFSLVVIMLPYANANLTDRKGNTNYIYQTRADRGTWYLSQLLVGMIGVFFVIAVPSFLNVILNGIAFNENGNQNLIHSQGMYIEAYFNSITGESAIRSGRGLLFRRLIYFHPQIYNVCYCLLFGASSAIISGFAYAVSLFVKKFTVLLYILPVTMIYVMEMLFWYICSHLDLSIDTAYKYYVCVSESKGYVYYGIFWAIMGLFLACGIGLSWLKGKMDEL